MGPYRFQDKSQLFKNDMQFTSWSGLSFLPQCYHSPFPLHPYPTNNLHSSDTELISYSLLSQCLSMLRLPSLMPSFTISIADIFSSLQNPKSSQVLACLWILPWCCRQMWDLLLPRHLFNTALSIPKCLPTKVTFPLESTLQPSIL